MFIGISNPCGVSTSETKSTLNSLPTEYRALNRAGLDWYLYSVKGSDDAGVGYPTSKPDYTSSDAIGTL